MIKSQPAVWLRVKIGDRDVRLCATTDRLASNKICGVRIVVTTAAGRATPPNFVYDPRRTNGRARCQSASGPRLFTSQSERKTAAERITSSRTRFLIIAAFLLCTSNMYVCIRTRTRRIEAEMLFSAVYVECSRGIS